LSSARRPDARQGPLFAIRLTVPVAAAGAFADALDEFAEAVSIFELAPGGDWKVEAIGPEPDMGRLGIALALVAATLGIAEPPVTVEPLPRVDWLAENRRSFKPLSAGRFLVHPSHDRPRAPGRIALCIDAGEAFGSGEHETTRGCLLAIDGLAKRWPRGRGVARRGRRGRALDMGCGTGILALAMALMWRTPVLGVDLAPEAVRVARDNARINAAATLVRAECADGFRARIVRRERYDLIAANILQRPLMAMAPALARRLRRGGRAILSGFYVDQAQAVIAAHRARGLAVERRIVLGAWCALTMRRK
jgi:ribosomal protein L11 methyltransferase